MSTVNNINTPELNNITMPPLDSVEFGSGLSTVFSNINQNFIRLAHRDFVKGESGDAVKIIPMSIVDETGEFNELGQKIQECISGLSNLQDKADQANIIDTNENVITIWDSIKNNSGSIYMIYNVPNDVSINNLTPVGSLPYVFLDGRFATNNIGQTISQDEYDNLTDFSCLLVYENGQFNALSNAFPTIYFDGTLGLCWKINGHNTGIPVQGMPGKNGENATMYMVRCNANNESNNAYVKKHKITHIHTMSDGYVDVATYAEDFDINDLNSAGAIILGYSDSDNNNEFFFGVISLENNELYANFANANSITVGFQSNEFLNSMRSIDIMNNGADGSIGIKGLFVPITTVRNSVLDDNGNPIQPVHLFTATSIVNEEGQGQINENHDAILTPVNNINTIDLSGDNELKVEKYLYLLINKNRNEIVNAVKDTNNTNLSKYNYILKYRLTSRVLKVQTEELPIYNGDIADNLYAYYKYDSLNNSNPETTDDVLETVPTEFRTRITDGKGLYKWVLNQTPDNFDPELLKEGLITGATYYYSEFSGLDLIKNIYTDTINPALDTKVLWFNGIETLDTVSIPDEDDPNTNKTKTILYGYHNGNEDETVFSFYKFTPVFNNSFKVDNDNALNINYNINITGEENASRNITINGGVNCENLKVYELTASGEIKNIYTNDDIIGNNGIKIGKIVDNRPKNANGDEITHSFEVNIDGQTNVNNTVNALALNCSNNQTSIPDYTVNTNNVISKTINTNTFKLNGSDGDRKVFVGNIGNVFSINSGPIYKLGVELKDVGNIDLSKSKESVKSNVTSDIPIIQSGNAGLVISNESDNSNIFYAGQYGKVSTSVASGLLSTPGMPSFPGTTPIHYQDPGTGVSVDKYGYINSNTFDTAKNFNIHRLAINTGITKTQTHSVVASALTQSKLTNQWKKSSTGSTSKRTLNTEITNNTEKLLEDITNNYVRKFTIKKSSNDEDKTVEFNATKPIEFTFNANSVCQIGIRGDCSNGKWPVLMSSSNMKLRLYCVIEGNLHQIKEFGVNGDETYSMDYTVSSNSKNSGNEWTGFNDKGEKLGGNWEWAVRYYSYAFKVDKFVLNPSSDKDGTYQKIANAYNQGHTIDIYLYPVFELTARGQEGKSIVDYITISNIVACNTATVNASKKLVKQSKYITVQDATYNAGASLQYNSNKITDGTQNNTTICENGIVMRSGKYVFGLGYGKVVNHDKQGYSVDDAGTEGSNYPYWNINDSTNVTDKYIDAPVLFYYEHDDEYYDIDNNTKIKEGKVGDDNEGYARRIQAIPLNDLFEMVRWWKENKN